MADNMKNRTTRLPDNLELAKDLRGDPMAPFHELVTTLFGAQQASPWLIPSPDKFGAPRTATTTASPQLGTPMTSPASPASNPALSDGVELIAPHFEYHGKVYKDIKVHIAVEGDKLRYKWKSGLKDTDDAEPMRNMK